MASTALSPAGARRVFLLLTWTRWFPVGLVIGVFTLLALERGLTVGQTLTYAAAQGVVVLLLELPTSGFADAFGRRPLLLAAGVVNVVAGLLYLRADSFATFAAAAACMGLYRALDSGPLEAWYVDTVHVAEPSADVDQALARQGLVMGVAIATGAVLSGGLVAWHPVSASSALALPVAVFVGLALAHLVATGVLMVEPSTRAGPGAWSAAMTSARATPAVVADGVRLIRNNRVLASVVGVEVFWVAAMTVFENFQPIRMSELLGSETAAGRVTGPVAAGGWAVFALGSVIAGRASRRIGVTRTAILARVLNGLGAVIMGVAAGPGGLVAAYLVTYSLHGAAAPMHSALLHREATAANRSTVLSLNSLVSFAAGAALGPGLGWLAQATTTPVAMMAGGGFSVLGAWFYLPALRQERRRGGHAKQ